MQVVRQRKGSIGVRQNRNSSGSQPRSNSPAPSKDPTIAPQANVKFQTLVLTH